MKRFNIRVYAVCRNERGEVLLSDEVHQGLKFTKFPGGGLEWGESFSECLIREFQEEFQLEIEVGELFYLTDFFQQSAFSENDQVISVYFEIKTSTEKLDEIILNNVSVEKLRWIKLRELSVENVTFPIDKKVVQFINNRK